MRVAGILQLEVNGERYDVKGNYSYNLGRPKRDAIVGMDRVHGYKEVPQTPFIEGAVTDRANLRLADLVNLTGVTATLLLANGKRIVLRDAWYAAEGTVSTEEAEIELRFEGLSADEVG